MVVNADALGSNSIFASSSKQYIVKITKGLNLKTVNAALSNQTLRDAKNISNIAVFFKTGGRPQDHSLQPVLSYEMPLSVSKVNTTSTKLQYFVDVTSDLTPTAFDCSDIRLHIILDHKEEVYVTKWLGYEGRQPKLPMDTGIVSIRIMQPGRHTISIIPEGRVDGCNSSNLLLSFCGTVVVYKK